jgi:hypothetical protein
MASNVYISKTHIEEFLKGDLDFKEVKETKSFTFSSSKSNFIINMLNLCKSDNISEFQIENFLKFIKYVEDLPPEDFNFDLFEFKEEHSNELGQKDSYLSFLNAIRHLILYSNCLTSKIKADFCKIERELMKIYLKKVIRKN